MVSSSPSRPCQRRRRGRRRPCRGRRTGRDELCLPSSMK